MRTFYDYLCVFLKTYKVNLHRSLFWKERHVGVDPWS